MGNYLTVYYTEETEGWWATAHDAYPPIVAVAESLDDIRSLVRDGFGRGPSFVFVGNRCDDGPLPSFEIYPAEEQLEEAWVDA